MRRKQTSIRFSRSALSHRYLRSISWVRRPQAAALYKLGRGPTLCRNCARTIFAAVPIPQGRNSCAPLPLLPPGGQANALRSFLKKKKTALFPFSRIFACRCSCVALPASSLSHVPPATHLRPVHHVAFCGPPINKKKCGPAALRREPAYQKKRRLLAQENTRRHAWLSRSCFGRKNLFIDGPHSLPSFFLSPFLQRKRKKKTEVNSAGSNTSLGLTSFVLTMYAIGPPRLVR